VRNSKSVALPPSLSKKGYWGVVGKPDSKFTIKVLTIVPKSIKLLLMSEENQSQILTINFL
jgi:hypothetical protein